VINAVWISKFDPVEHFQNPVRPDPVLNCRIRVVSRSGNRIMFNTDTCYSSGLISFTLLLSSTELLIALQLTVISLKTLQFSLL